MVLFEFYVMTDDAGICRDACDDLESWIAANDAEITGYVDDPLASKELQGLPKLSGWIGPIVGAKAFGLTPVIQYADAWAIRELGLVGA
ncbi:MAG: hypothetical protein DI616_14585 [Paracoccus denitrificans]|uniref:Uncharacterized protein n=2 Tax=Paracoccus TaxID=265 RepID=A0A1G7G6M6_9RHOB|nr:hypothetical protein [Paracoccus isoporae]TKW65399.1 MAG: hypothetical protein DI616_14585 [Paracoccus denitrificans]SDE83689.1 hypothetical protein SAMN05421538_11271 [Paracoccus isoporae]